MQIKKGYVGIHSSGFKDFLLKPELLRAIQDCGFEHPSEGTFISWSAQMWDAMASPSTPLLLCVQLTTMTCSLSLSLCISPSGAAAAASWCSSSQQKHMKKKTTKISTAAPCFAYTQLQLQPSTDTLLSTTHHYNQSNCSSTWMHPTSHSRHGCYLSS